MAIFINESGERESVKPRYKSVFSLNELQKYVNGYIAIISLNNGFIMVVNDEGLINGSKYNPVASLLSLTLGGTGCIYGNVLLCKNNEID